MILAFDIKDLPGEALTVLLLMLFSFVGWLKKRFFDKPVEPPAFEDEEMREVIWRRQMGEASEDTRMPWEAPEEAPPTVHFEPPATPRVAVRATPPALPPRVAEVSQRESDLANTFEQSIRRKGRRRTSHRRNIDRLLNSPSAAKDAILLMEILGSPVGLKPEHQPDDSTADSFPNR